VLCRVEPIAMLHRVNHFMQQRSRRVTAHRCRGITPAPSLDNGLQSWVPRDGGSHAGSTLLRMRARAATTSGCLITGVHVSVAPAGQAPTIPQMAAPNHQAGPPCFCLLRCRCADTFRPRRMLLAKAHRSSKRNRAPSYKSSLAGPPFRTANGPNERCGRGRYFFCTAQKQKGASL